MNTISNSLLPFAAVLFSAAGALAQCKAVVTPSEGVPGVYGQVEVAMPWDPDGPGGNPAWTVIAGSFTLAGDAATRNIAAWDGQQWQAFGPGLGTAVTALAVMPNGELVAAARFAGGLSQVLRWSGGQWLVLGSALFSGTIQCMAVSPVNGALWLGGDIASSFSPTAAGIAVYTGGSWTNVGAVGGGEVRCITFDASGTAYVGGSFTSIGPFALPSIAKYTPSSGWQPLGAGIGSPVIGMALLPSGQIAAFAGSDLVRHWNGSSWILPVQPQPLFAQRFCVGSSGVLLVATSASSPSSPSFVSRWTGTSWQVDSVLTSTGVPLAELGGGVVLSRSTWGAASSSSGVARLRLVGTGGEQTLGGGFLSQPRGRYFPRHAMLLAIGPYWSQTAASLRSVTEWTGTAWQPVAGIASDFDAFCLLETPAGDPLVGGHRGGSTVVMRRIQSGWVEHHVASALLYPQSVVMVGAQDFFVAAGPFGMTPIYRYVGGVGTLLHNPLATSGLFLDPNGDVLMLLSANQPATLRFTGGIWVNDGLLHAGTPQVLRGSYEASGSVLVLGALNLPGGALAGGARWNGSTWSATLPIGSLLPPPSAVLPGGDEVQAVGGLLVRDGPSGTQLIAGFDGAVSQLQLDQDGTLHAFGGFASSSGVPAGFHAAVVSSCPATATTYGATCSSSVGSLVLTTAAKPWAGTTFTAQLDGLPAGALTVVAYGFDPVDVLLSVFLPEAVPGCRLLTTLEILSAGISAGSAIETSVALPAIPAAIGEELHHQGFVLDASSGSLQVSSSNALQLVVGAW